jgi:hypothetical protein
VERREGARPYVTGARGHPRNPPALSPNHLIRLLNRSARERPPATFTAALRVQRRTPADIRRDIGRPAHQRPRCAPRPAALASCLANAGSSRPIVDGITQRRPKRARLSLRDPVRRHGPSVKLPITRHGRAVWGVSHVWHATGAWHRHPHQWSRHARIAPLVTCVILGLGVHILGSRRIMLEGRDRSTLQTCRGSAMTRWCGRGSKGTGRSSRAPTSIVGATICTS